MIEGIRGVDYKGDISIDDIEIADHACPAPCEYLAVSELVYHRYSPGKLHYSKVSHRRWVWNSRSGWKKLIVGVGVGAGIIVGCKKLKILIAGEGGLGEIGF